MKKVTLVITFACLIIFGETFSQTSELDTLALRNQANEKLSLKIPEGQEFWLCFMQNYKSDEQDRGSANALMLELFLTSEKDADVTISIKALNYEKKIKVPALTVQNVKISPLAELVSSEIIEPGMSVKITSNVPISVYGLNRRFQTTDTYLGLPKNVLGTTYRIMSYTMSSPLMPEFAIVATENNTMVQITPTATTQANNPANKPFVVTLNQGDVYQVIAKPSGLFYDKIDFTGTYIHANKPIAVFGGHQCAYVPSPPPVIIACNHLVEQIPPISSWGKHYFIGRLEKRSKYTWRALANLDSTKLFVNSKLVKILKAGEFYEDNSSTDIQVSADKPILVAQYSQGYRNGDSIGDPAMILISPTQQFLTRYRFATPVNGQWNHFVSIVIPTVAIPTLKLNGKKIDESKFRQIGMSRYSIATIEVPYGTHSLTAAQPFGMYSYGFGYGNDAFDAYGTMGGQSFIEYEPALDTLPPLVDFPISATSITGIARDDRDDDTGIGDIIVVANENLDIKIQKFVEGAPQVSFSINPINLTEGGRAILRINDVALNTKFFTVCYQFDQTVANFRFSVTEGQHKECEVVETSKIGIFVAPTFVFHSANFVTTGEVNNQVLISPRVLGKFSEASDLNNGFGISLTDKLMSRLYWTIKFYFDRLNGTLEAPDETIGSTRHPDTGELVPFQEGRTLSLDNSVFNVSAEVNYYFHKILYGIAGFSLLYSPDKSIIYQSKILQPNYLEYPTYIKTQIEKQYPRELSSLRTINFGLYAGIGLSYPIRYDFSVFFETYYNTILQSLIDDGDWKVSKLSLLFGLKYSVNLNDLWPKY